MKMKALLAGGIAIILAVAIFMVLNGRGKSAEKQTDSNSPTQNQQQSQSQTNETTITAKPQENKLCDWIDEYGIVIKLNFAEGVTKDTSYEAGFAYSPVGSDRRLARAACDYRTAFKQSEMKNKGAVQVVVRGYTDIRQRQLSGEPITVIFDADGKPNVKLPIEVTVLD